MGPEHEGSGKFSDRLRNRYIGHRFNGAGARGLRKMMRMGTICGMIGSFNGAGARGLRKMASTGETMYRSMDASMGPEHEGSGKSRIPC